MYRVYTHTDGYFTPPADERQGAAPDEPPVRRSPGPEVLDDVKARVNDAIEKILASGEPPGQMQMQLLARAYRVEWTKAHQNPRVVERVVEGLDAVYAKYRADREFAWRDPSTWNPDWFGLGPSGQSIMLLAKPLAASFDEPVRRLSRSSNAATGGLRCSSSRASGTGATAGSTRTSR